MSTFCIAWEDIGITSLVSVSGVYTFIEFHGIALSCDNTCTGVAFLACLKTGLLCRGSGSQHTEYVTGTGKGMKIDSANQ